MADRSLTHGLKYQARAIAPVLAEPRRLCWLVGTNAIREENEARWSCACIPRPRALDMHCCNRAPRSFCMHRRLLASFDSDCRISSTVRMFSAARH